MYGIKTNLVFGNTEVKRVGITFSVWVIREGRD